MFGGTASTSGFPQRGKKPRASKPKVKTGCITCKKRHVKCDETKPDCKRCTNFGRKCEGYPTEDDETPPPKEPVNPGTRRLLSKAIQESMPFRPLQQAIPVALPFNNEQEYYYFCLFRDKTSIELSAGFEPTLWSILVLQACDNPSIRELTSATAALNLSVKDSNLARMHGQGNWAEINAHRHGALLLYGKALKGIQEMVSTGQDSIRIALIAALLIFCFESILGDTRRAIIPIESSLKMILKRLAQLPRLYRSSRTRPRGKDHAPPIDEDLLSAFMRLDGPSLALINKRDNKPAYPTNKIFELIFMEDEFSIPSGFATVSEARLYLEEIKWRVLPDQDTEDPAHLPRSRTVTPVPPYLLPDYHSGMNTIASSIEELDHSSLHSDLPIMYSQLDAWYRKPITSLSSTLITQFEQWHQAFAPLLEHSMTPAGSSTFLSAATLYIQALSNDLTIAEFGSRSMSPSFSDTKPSESARIIISLSRRIIAHPEFSRGFVFDIGLIPALVLILMLCPDRGLKWEASEVVKSMVPRREGVWDSRVVAEAADRLLMEECSEQGEEAEGEPDAMEQDLLEPVPMIGGMADLRLRGSSYDSGDEVIDPRLRNQGDNSGADLLRRYLGS